MSAAAASGSRVGGSGCASARHCKLLWDLIAIEDLYEDQRLQMARARCCFDIRRVMRAMVRTYQITMGRAYYKCTLGFSSTSNVTDTYVATLFFTLPSLHPPYLGRHQNGSQQRTVTRTRRLSLELDDGRLNNQLANTTNDLINRSIELRPPREVPKTTTVRMYSQRTTIENDSN